MSLSLKDSQKPRVEWIARFIRQEICRWPKRAEMGKDVELVGSEQPLEHVACFSVTRLRCQMISAG